MESNNERTNINSSSGNLIAFVLQEEPPVLGWPTSLVVNLEFERLYIVIVVVVRIVQDNKWTLRPARTTNKIAPVGVNGPSNEVTESRQIV